MWHCTQKQHKLVMLVKNKYVLNSTLASFANFYNAIPLKNTQPTTAHHKRNNTLTSLMTTQNYFTYRSYTQKNILLKVYVWHSKLYGSEIFDNWSTTDIIIESIWNVFTETVGLIKWKIKMFWKRWEKKHR